MKILFLDESGDHDLVHIDQNYPVFVLSGCILDEKIHGDAISKSLLKLKKDCFGIDKIILHYADYTRNRNGFEKMADKSLREKFYLQLNSFIKESDFVLIACVIDKIKHGNKYGLSAIDPYLLSLEVLVERFVIYLREAKEKGLIIAESRNPQLDNALNLAFLNLKINGTRFLRPKEIIEYLEDLRVRKKEENIAGLQLVDSLVTPIGRKYLGKMNYYIKYEEIKKKFRKHICGKYRGYGLVILPR